LLRVPAVLSAAMLYSNDRFREISEAV